MRYTLTAPASYEEEIRKSRFLVHACSVASIQEAMDFLSENAVPTATHNCWAYRIGELYRFNDDGEPGGTAGRPILQAIESQQCDKVVVLVVRWFGGIKLGSGGLVRAYGGAAAQCLRLASKTELIQETEVECHCLFGDMALVRSRMAGFGIRIVQEQFDESGVQWRLAVPSAQTEDFLVALTDLTRGQARAELVQ